MAEQNRVSRAERGDGVARHPDTGGRATESSSGTDSSSGSEVEGLQTLELREEELIARRELRELGEVVVRTQVDEVPSQIEVQALREEVEVEHVAAGQMVSERREPWEEGDTLVVPVYEEQLVVTKRLILREHLRIRRVQTRQTQVFEDTVRKDRLVVEDPSNTGMVHERYSHEGQEEPRVGERAGFLERFFKRVLQ